MFSKVNLFVALCVFFLITLVTGEDYTFTVGPGGDIPVVKFEAQFVVPEFSKGVGRHMVGASITNQAQNYRWFDELNDHNVGTWEVLMLLDNSGIATDSDIHQGDRIHSVFEFNSTTGITTNTVTIIPTGEASMNAGLGQRSKSTTSNLQQDAPQAGQLNLAKLYVRFDEGAIWDFGVIFWENVVITAQTTESLWCVQAFKASDNLAVSGRVTEYWLDGDKINCMYGFMAWQTSRTDD